MSKKDIRNAFRNGVFKRDDYKCKMCGLRCYDMEHVTDVFDAHHIIDRSLMPNGGYVLENGITLCKHCHLHAEYFHCTGTATDGYHPDDLYNAIGSSYEEALDASEKLK